MKKSFKVICTLCFLAAVCSVDAQVKITDVKDLQLKAIKDTSGINSQLLYRISNPIRCMVEINGVNKDNTLLNVTGTRYNTGGAIAIDVSTETIVFKTAGLYHLEGSFFVFFLDNGPHELLLGAKINGQLLEPLDYKVAPANTVGYAPIALKFQNDVYFTAGTTFQLILHQGAQQLRGFFSANYISQ